MKKHFQICPNFQNWCDRITPTKKQCMNSVKSLFPGFTSFYWNLSQIHALTFNIWVNQIRDQSRLFLASGAASEHVKTQKINKLIVKQKYKLIHSQCIIFDSVTVFFFS